MFAFLLEKKNLLIFIIFFLEKISLLFSVQRLIIGLKKFAYNYKSFMILQTLKLVDWDTLEMKPKTKIV